MAAVEEAVEEPLVFTSTTPSGIEIQYSPSPRRYYALRSPERPDGSHNFDWFEVPSVTTVLGCLDKPLSWWGMKIGVAGVLELVKRGIVAQESWLEDECDYRLGDTLVDATGIPVDADDVVRFLTQEKLTVNHTLSNAGDRGTSVHDAFENWCKAGVVPHPEIYPESEAGYITGLLAFIRDFDAAGVRYPKTEVTVGSLEHKFAGRYDLDCEFNGGKMVAKSYPKRADKVERFPAGRYLCDVKTSSGVYPSHALQLAAYEGARIECGYEPTDYRAVIHITADGRYEFVQTHATFDDFLSVRRTYDVLQRAKKS